MPSLRRPQHIGVFQRPGPPRWMDARKPRGPEIIQDTRVGPTLTPEQMNAAAKAIGKSWGVDDALYDAKKREILLHMCFNQRRGDAKPHRCDCDNRVSYPTARNLIDHDLADFLKYTRRGEVLENRKSIVVTAEFLRLHAKSMDVLNHKKCLSISGFAEYHIASLSSEASSGLDNQIQSVRLGTIAERKKEVTNRREHRVTTANFRKGAGGLTVGDRGKVVDLTQKNVRVKKGVAVDSDSSREDMANGQGVGQMSSKPDHNYGRDLGAENPYAPKPAAKGSKAEKLESDRNLQDPVAKVGAEETRDHEKQALDTETTVFTGPEI